ncbi:hypothetical protein [Rodentibacter caecimuris]|uniref:Beta-ketoacyl synthase N-terminal domain-containing protein n=1 Tax=Rodentibacter caecimuris TaxID=1796644 RepID=A0ABX3KZR8_9PAST|nr:hypothetical protein BKG89_02830 [Rodentibacter heylii]
MEVIAEYRFEQQLDDKALRLCLKEHEIDTRRLSRFTALALLGALPLRGYLNEESAIYLGSSFNSPTKFWKLFNNLMLRGMPSPLDFMANISNAATFQLAQSLNLNGTSLFLALEKSQLSQLFELAELDLSVNQTALVGWVFEHYRQDQKDESVWWVVKR